MAIHSLPPSLPLFPPEYCYYYHQLRVLLEAGADPTQAVVHGITPVGIAELHGHVGCVTLLEVREREREVCVDKGKRGE